jgi:hypothetical protein
MNKYQKSLILIATGLSGASCSSMQHAPTQTVRTVSQVPVVQASASLTQVAWKSTNQSVSIDANHYARTEIQRAISNNTPRLPHLSSNELRMIGDKIFNNESGANKDKLVHWNDNENFASMGIGHWTWYPAGRNARFGNTFPELLSYLEQNGVNLPYWLQEAKHRGAPWSSKAAQAQARRTPQIQQLTQILYDTRDLQAKFILQRAERAIPRLVKAAPANQRARVIRNVEALMNTVGGRYALIDYINFKGEGLRMNSGYRGQNWGVLQVLLRMDANKRGSQVLNEFANAALYVLERRVRNSPQSRHESRWLSGWSNRVNTYRNPWV